MAALIVATSGIIVNAQNSVPAPGSGANTKSALNRWPMAGAGTPNSLPAPGAGQSTSLPQPGAGGSYRPNTFPLGPNGIGWNPGWHHHWAGSAWNTSWNPAAGVGPVVIGPNTNRGIEKVIACGFDSEGIWRILPLQVSYRYNGVQYVVYVLNAWNPWTDNWDLGVNQRAYLTDMYFHGVEYDYYAPLPTGTYFFNL